MKSLFVVVFSGLMLFGCSQARDRSDLAVYIRALQGKTTYKETLLCLERTSHARLVEQKAYLVKNSGSGTAQTRSLREGESVEDVIEELDGLTGDGSGEFFLVRGIGKESEKIVHGRVTQLLDSGLQPMAGDLLVIDPPPDHALFKEYEQTL